MKIEIELSELERLREMNKTLEKRVEETEDKLNQLDERELKRRAVELSIRLFDEYARLVFIKLGFKQPNYRKAVNFSYDLDLLGAKWWEKSEKITVELSARVSNFWREAFINIGVKMEPKEPNDKTAELEL